MTLPVWIDTALFQRLVLTYSLAVAGGASAAAIDIPLVWMLGPFFICGAAASAGVQLATLPFARELGQLMVGLGIGLWFGPATLWTTLSLLPAMLVSILYVTVYTKMATLLIRPLADVNPTMAFFATAAGGMTDMAAVAGERGGDSAAVSIVHAIRVSVTVAIVPFLVIVFGILGGAPGAGPVTTQVSSGSPSTSSAPFPLYA